MKRIKNIPQRRPLPEPANPAESPEPLQWPEMVGIISAEDINKSGTYRKGGTYCLLGHLGALGQYDTGSGAFLRYSSTDTPFKVYLQVRRRLAERVEALTGYDLIAEANDEIMPKALCARVWNATMCDFGYTEGNPESAHIAP